MRLLLISAMLVRQYSRIVRVNGCPGWIPVTIHPLLLLSPVPHHVDDTVVVVAAVTDAVTTVLLTHSSSLFPK